MDKVALIHERDRLEFLFNKATRFEFGPIKVEDRGHDRWAVIYNGCCYHAVDGWVWEPMPSGRDDNFLISTRFRRSTAIELAERMIKQWSEDFGPCVDCGAKDWELQSNARVCRSCKKTHGI